MIVRVGRAQKTGPDSPVDKRPDTHVTGALPASMTSFIGRSRELDELRSLFRTGKRLVTLVGIGGVGKTRLALELGWSANDLGWANVYLVELASLTPDMVDDAVLESVGGGSSRSPLQTAAEYLRDATTLLVLDCCEHALDAVSHVAEVLLRRCPSVTILATSRSPIKIAGELVWAVPPLSIQARGDVGETGASDAARLFADRASYMQSRFELSESTAGAVETIVRRVDGIPLAIELAAARVRVLSPGEIADGLDDHLRMLRGGHRSDPRHQTIRASLDWSHELLTDQERQLLPGCRSSREASTWKRSRRYVPGVPSSASRYSTRSRAWWTSPLSFHYRSEFPDLLDWQVRSLQDRVRRKLFAITVTGCHLIPVIRGAV